MLTAALVALAFGAAGAVAGDDVAHESAGGHQSLAEDNRTERVAEQTAHAVSSLVTGSISRRPGLAKAAPVAKAKSAPKPASTAHSAKSLAQAKSVMPIQSTSEVQRIQRAAFGNDKGQ